MLSFRMDFTGERVTFRQMPNALQCVFYQNKKLGSSKLAKLTTRKTFRSFESKLDPNANFEGVSLVFSLLNA